MGEMRSPAWFCLPTYFNTTLVLSYRVASPARGISTSRILRAEPTDAASMRAMVREETAHQGNNTVLR
jgi:hypothetical protein